MNKPLPLEFDPLAKKALKTDTDLAKCSIGFAVSLLISSIIPLFLPPIQEMGGLFQFFGSISTVSLYGGIIVSILNIIQTYLHSRKYLYDGRRLISQSAIAFLAIILIRLVL